MTTKREIVRRWMATESFEWTAGMLAHDHRDRFWRLFNDADGGISAIQEGAFSCGPWDDDTEKWTGEWAEQINAVPDLNDKATLGLLLLTSMTELPSTVDVEKLVDMLEDSS